MKNLTPNQVSSATHSLFQQPRKPENDRKLYLTIAVLVLAISLIIGWLPIKAVILQQRAMHFMTTAWAAMDDSSGGIACLQGELGDEEARSAAKEAAQYLKKAVELRPRQFFIYYRQGQALCLAGEYSEAAIAFDKATQLRPQNHLAGVERGFALEKACPPKGECANADQSVSVWKTAGVTADQFVANGENARKLEDYEQAITWFERAQRMGADLRSTIGYTNYQLCTVNDTYCTESTLSYAIKTDTGWVDERSRFLAWYDYGRLVFTNHNWTDAEQILQKAVTLYPSSNSYYWVLSDTHRLLGLALANQKKNKEALIHIKKAVELDPNSYWAHIHYGVILFDSDKSNLTMAQRQFDLGLNLAGVNAVVWDDVVRNLILFNQPEIAQQYCDEAMKKGVDMAAMQHCIHQ